MTHSPLKLRATPLKSLFCERIKTLPVLVRIGAQPLPAARPPVSVAIAMDCSGSMQGERLAALREGVQLLLDGLRDDDEVVLVSFRDNARNQLARCPVRLARLVAPTLLERLQAGGQTALADGWWLAARQLREDAASGRVCRVVLMTDGQANKGETDVATLANRAARLAAHGTTTTTIGLGTGFNESLLQAMADRGMGSELFAERAEDLATTFESELSLLNHLVVREARLRVERLEGAQCLNGYTREHDGAWLLPGIAADTEGWALLELPMEALINGQRGAGMPILTVEATLVTGQRVEMSIRVPETKEVSEAQWYATPEDPTVARRYQELKMAQLQSDLRDCLRSGDRERAEQVLQAMARLAEGHDWLQAIVEENRAMLARRDAALEKELAYQGSKLRKRMIVEAMRLGLTPEELARLPGYLQERRREGRR